MKVTYAEKNERRRTLYKSAAPGHKEGRSLRKQSPHGAFGDKSRAAVNVELMVMGTIREGQ